MNIFFDTNLWLRYFIGDHEEHLSIVRKILELNEESKLNISSSTFVLSEIVYTQQSFYQIKRADIISDIQTICSIKNLLLIERTNLEKTLKLFSIHKNAKWSDCIIVAQVPANYQLCSFDQGLAKIIGEKRFVTPEKVINSSPPDSSRPVCRQAGDTCDDDYPSN